MTSGADLFVVCKQCGSEVSPYVTECPYCGTRLRRRAPKLPRVNAGTAPPASRSGLMSRLRSRGTRTKAAKSPSRRAYGTVTRWEGVRPNATIALVAASCVAWVLVHAKGDMYLQMAVIGPLHGDWWKLFTTQFAYLNGIYAFVAIFAVGIFGTLTERRHGPVVVLALFFGAGAAGALAALAAYPIPLVSGAHCWPPPHSLEPRRRRRCDETHRYPHDRRRRHLHGYGIGCLSRHLLHLALAPPEGVLTGISARHILPQLFQPHHGLGVAGSPPVAARRKRTAGADLRAVGAR